QLIHLKRALLEKRSEWENRHDKLILQTTPGRMLLNQEVLRRSEVSQFGAVYDFVVIKENFLMNIPLLVPLLQLSNDIGKELRYPLLDYNGKNVIGFSYAQATTINGTRMCSNRAYLHPARNRQNLHVTRRVTSGVKKVLINRAIGVEFIRHPRSINVFASKEMRQIWNKYSNTYRWTILSMLLKSKNRARAHTHTHTQLIIYEIRCMQVIGIHGL
ncbi:Glucose dehydrogenase [acceptor], partial [Atta colombica]